INSLINTSLSNRLQFSNPSCINRDLIDGCNTCRNAAANASLSSGSECNAVPLLTSGMGSISLATTGAPHAWASIKGQPNPSLNDGKMNASQALYRATNV